jgi:hypothetical protein
VFDEDSGWRDWSDAMLTRAADRGALVINPIIFAEVSAGFDSLDDVEAALPPSFVRREALPWEAAFDRLPFLISTSAPTPRWPATRC